MTILILGGTSEARALAAELVRRGDHPISSLAGRVTRPALPLGRVRVGGFGGVDGLITYLQAAGITLVVDATHPFAARISANAALAAARTQIPFIRLERPGWRHHPDSAGWTWVPDAAAARLAADPYRRPFLTTGRQSLPDFLPWSDRPVLARVVDPPKHPVPDSWSVLQARGPYDRAAERSLMQHREVDVLLTKDSGGTMTGAKLDAARDLAVPVVVIERPPRPPGVPTVPSVDDVLESARLRKALGRRRD